MSLLFDFAGRFGRGFREDVDDGCRNPGAAEDLWQRATAIACTYGCLQNVRREALCVYVCACLCKVQSACCVCLHLSVHS